ncbi:MAG: thiamine diphosphokinase [Clostridiales bacterium]|nr:thiamine diphosphokinase [Clostridiales bacterium]
MKSLIVLGGTPIPLKEYVNEDVLIIAADGGADILIAQDFLPDVLLGDMDSISDCNYNKCKEHDVKIIKHPIKKDVTDGQLAVKYAKDNNIIDIDIVCAEGSVDHYLGNLYLLLYAKKNQITAKLHTKDMTVQAVSDTIIIKGNVGKRVSIVPADGDITVRKTSGLYYEIEDDLTISFGETIGLGNHMTANKANICMQKGTAFVITQKK